MTTIKHQTCVSLLVAGHRPDRLPEDDQERAALFRKLEDLIAAFRDALGETDSALPGPCSLRLITGDAKGSDEQTARIARKQGIPLQLLLAGPAPDKEPQTTERIIALGGPTANGGPAAEQAYGIRDEIALLFADILIAVWDGDMPAGHHAGGTVRLVHQALLQQKPVLWLNTRGELSLSGLDELNDTFLHQLRACLAEPDMLGKAFGPVGEKLSTLCRKLIGNTVAPWKNYAPDDKETQERIHAVYEKISRPENSPRYMFAGMTHGVLGGLLALNKEKFVKAVAGDARKPYTEDVELQAKDAGSFPIVQPGCLIDTLKNIDPKANIAGGRHRGSIWAMHIFAAVAIFAAVTGVVFQLSPATSCVNWGGVELATLSLIVVIYSFTQKADWHREWISRRFVSEQLRYSLMSLPLLSFPRLYSQPIWSIRKNADSSSLTLQLKSAELWVLRRVLRDTGLPEASSNNPFYAPHEHNARLVEYVLGIVEDQGKKYHVENHQYLDKIHKRLHFLTKAAFVLSILGVIVHLVCHPPWALYLTAFLPALAAALHGIESNLEFSRLAKQSAMAADKLDSIHGAISNLQEDLHADGADPWRAWVRLRALTSEAAEIMSDENALWVSVLSNNKPTPP